MEYKNSYKIAFVLDDTLDTADGVQQYTLTLGSWLAEQGHEVHYLVGETSRTDIPNVHSLSRNIKVRFNHNRMSMPLPASRSMIRRFMRKEEFDIVHVQMPYSPFLAGRIIRAAGPQTGVVGTFHIAPHSRLVSFANWLLRLMIRRSLRRFDEIASVSRVAQDFAWQTFGVESAIVPNTLRLDDFYNAKSFERYRRTKNIVFVGRLVERKGCRYLLEAVAKLHREKRLPADTRIIVCGKGPQSEDLQLLADHLGLHKIIEFTGFISEADKPRYLASADIAVYPSTGGESFGIVLLEAMAAGRGAVLAGNNPGYAGVLGERPEVLFEPTDIEQFADKLDRYLQDGNQREQCRTWQQQFVRQFDVPNVADEIIVLYDEALHNRRS